MVDYIPKEYRLPQFMEAYAASENAVDFHRILSGKVDPEILAIYNGYKAADNIATRKNMDANKAHGK